MIVSSSGMQSRNFKVCESLVWKFCFLLTVGVRTWITFPVCGLSSPCWFEGTIYILDILGFVCSKLHFFV